MSQIAKGMKLSASQREAPKKNGIAARKWLAIIIDWICLSCFLVLTLLCSLAMSWLSTVKIELVHALPLLKPLQTNVEPSLSNPNSEGCTNMPPQEHLGIMAYHFLLDFGIEQLI
jgi:hypothetical protein